jgi:hypothetical protein
MENITTLESTGALTSTTIIWHSATRMAWESFVASAGGTSDGVASAMMTALDNVRIRDGSAWGVRQRRSMQGSAALS